MTTPQNHLQYTLLATDILTTPTTHNRHHVEILNSELTIGLPSTTTDNIVLPCESLIPQT